MKKSFAAFCLCCSLFVGQAEAKLFDISEYRLSNGATLLVVPNHKAPIAKHMVWYKIGAADEAAGKGGSAHLLEHLMFRGTKKVSGNEFNRLMQVNGIVSNAFTSLDYTAYHQSLDISRLELAMALEADRMQNLKFSEQDFVTERDIVYQERKQVVENKPMSLFFENTQKNLWQNHPYGKSVSGSEEEILSLSADDVKDIYNRYYAPSNAVIVISGDIDPETAFRLTEKYYGKVPSRQTAEKKKFPTINQSARTEMSISLPRVELPRIVRSYVTDSYAVNKENIYALSVLSTYLGEGETSELYKELVDGKNVALAVSTSYNYAARSYGSFSLAAVPVRNVSVSELKKNLDEAVKKAVADIDDKNIAKVKNKMLAGLVYLKDNPFDAANIVGMLYTIGMSKEDIENYADNIRAVTVEDVKNAAHKLFEKSAVTEAVVYPLSEENDHE